MDKENLLNMYRIMVKLREFEKECIKLKMQDLIMDGFHSYWGQEAMAVGVCSALEKTDYLLSTHRGQGHFLAKGCDPKKVFAEMMGRVGGFAKGKGGPMHMYDREHRILSTGIVGSGIPLATGLGLAIKMKRSSEIVACFFGDGAVNTGAFHEGLNLASLWKLPIVFICENNMYAQTMYVSLATLIKDLSKRAGSYGMEGRRVDGNDVLSVYETFLELSKKAREGKGPSLLVGDTYRIRGHFEGDPEHTYRTKKEVKQWGKKDPIVRMKRHLIRGRLCSEEELGKLEQREKESILETESWAKSQPFPSFEILNRGVYYESR